MITPDFVGQIYKDTNTGNLWRANSLTPGDWTLELQNMKIMWQPRTEALSDAMGFTYESNVQPTTHIEFLQTIFVEPVLIACDTVVSLRFPNLTDVDPGFYWGSDLNLQGSLLEEVYLPLLDALDSGKLIIVSPVITSIDLPSLVKLQEGLNFQGCSSLASVSFPNYLPRNGKPVDVSNCALSAASVNHILARCVANAAYVTGVVNTGGGTSAAPSGQGIVDKATLIGRGCTVTTN